MLKLNRILFVVALLSLATLAFAALPDGFYRYPTVGGGKIVFASEGDLWSIPETGGTAMRLTAYEGEERFPKISPDGNWIVFTAQYEGNDDIYVIPSVGGEPKRLTWHPSPDQAIGWTTDNRIIFRSRRDTPHQDYRLYTVSPAGGIPEMIPLEPAAWISFEPNGKRVAYQKIGLEFHNWKRYRGGEAEDIWVGTINPTKFEWVTHDYTGKDAFPMWHTDGRIYFLTDRWGRPNLASITPDGKDLKRHTHFEDYDIRWPFYNAGKIVYQHGMDVWMYDIASNTNRKIDVQLPSDRLQVRERFMDPENYLSYFSLSHTGDRMALVTRGDIFTARTKKSGFVRRITDNSATRVKYGAFSPDGKSIAAWSEVDGEEQLVLFSSDLTTAPKQIGTIPPGWQFPPTFSPDGKKIAYTDDKLHLWIADATTGARYLADSAAFEVREYVFSPDSRYLMYTYQVPNGFGQIRIFDTQDKSAHIINSTMYNAFSPSWDPNGKYIAFLMDHHFNPRLSKFDATYTIDEATRPYIVALQADGKLPFALLSDIPSPDDEKSSEADDEKQDKSGKSKGDKADKKNADEKPVEPIRIDFDGIINRIIEVPVEPANYYGLEFVDGKLHFIEYESDGMMPAGSDDEEEDSGDMSLLTYDIEKKKLSTLINSVTGYTVSGDKKVLVYRTKSGFYRIDAGAEAAPKDDDAKDSKIDLDAMRLKVDPRKEWSQMFREAWRLQRDFFYDKNMAGTDWNAVWKQYSPFLARISTRDDLNDMIGEMLGELSTGHTYWWGGDLRRGKFVGTGLLGADLKYDANSGFWQITHIYRGDWPNALEASPLARSDLNVKEGDWIVAIDGKPLEKNIDILARLANRAGIETELSVHTKPALDGARRIIIKPIPSDAMVRYTSWVNDTRDYVAKKSGGKIGYIHLYDMGGRGLQAFSREYYPQHQMPGLIMDDRWNHGGFVAPMLLSHLNRKVLEYGKPRNGAIYTSPWGLFTGHSICLINRQGGSDCETFAEGFKTLQLGPVVGERTWGGLVGIRSDKPFKDGGMTTQPEYGSWDVRGTKWVVEGHGVDPDVELDLDPSGFLDNKDEQIDYAIDYLMKKIAEDPRSYPPPPQVIPRQLKPVK